MSRYINRKHINDAVVADKLRASGLPSFGLTYLKISIINRSFRSGALHDPQLNTTDVQVRLISCSSSSRDKIKMTHDT